MTTSNNVGQSNIQTNEQKQTDTKECKLYDSTKLKDTQK